MIIYVAIYFWLYICFAIYINKCFVSVDNISGCVLKIEYICFFYIFIYYSQGKINSWVQFFCIFQMSQICKPYIVGIKLKGIGIKIQSLYNVFRTFNSREQTNSIIILKLNLTSKSQVIKGLAILALEVGSMFHSLGNVGPKFT